MGMYDTFIDGDSEIQLKNFDCVLITHKKGDKIRMKGKGCYGCFKYPKDGIFYCSVNSNEVVVIQKSVFIGIMALKKALKKYSFRIWDCQGNEYVKKKKEVSEK